MQKKMLIIGASGLTGYKLVQNALSKYDVIGTFNTRSVKIENTVMKKIDATDYDKLTTIFSEIKPDIVINTTALHNVDYCEENRDYAAKVNAGIVKTLYQNSEHYGSQLIHISTDYVFDGNVVVPYKESDVPNPINFYGQTKLQGEKILENTKHVTIRPSVIYGWTPLELAGTTSSSGKPINFALWALMKLNKNESMRIVTDQFASATLADSLAESVIKIADSEKSGLYHISGLSCESRYDFTIKLATKFGYDASLISPVTSSEFMQKAKRPNYSCLDCKKATKDFGLKLLTTDDALDVMKSQVEKEAPQLLGPLF